MDALGHYRSTCENTRQVLESGSPVRQAFDDAGRGNARAVITDAMLRFERLRHASRLSLFALGAEEGVTKAEVSDALGSPASSSSGGCGSRGPRTAPPGEGRPRPYRPVAGWSPRPPISRTAIPFLPERLTE